MARNSHNNGVIDGKVGKGAFSLVHSCFLDSNLTVNVYSSAQDEKHETSG